MMLDLYVLHSKYKMQVHGVLHVGAHLGEEAQSYDDLDMAPITWVEANPAVMDKLRPHVHAYGQRVIRGLVYSKDDVELDFHVTNHDGMSSSILEFGTHTEFSQDTWFERHLRLKTVTIDTLVKRHHIDGNFLVMDIQGAELHALVGAKKFLKTVEYVMLEVNTAEVYLHCAKLPDLDNFLNDFRRVETHMVGDQGWGDAFWIRR